MQHITPQLEHARERLEQNEKREHILRYIITEAWTLLEPREDDSADNWRGYVEAHAADMLDR